MNEKLQKLVEEWRGLARAYVMAASSSSIARGAAYKLCADQLAAELAGGEGACPSHNHIGGRCQNCGAPAHEAPSAREATLVEAGRRAFGSLDAVGCECDAEYGSPGEVCIYCGLKAALSPYPPSEKEGEKS